MYERGSVVYTGTHDNDTTLGWYSHLDGGAAQLVDRYLGTSGAAALEALLRLTLGSVARLAIIPVQDLLGLGSEARLNTPGTVSGNWAWRLPPSALTPELARRFAELNAAYGRS
jgi:4-alpha-glucanotransferase